MLLYITITEYLPLILIYPSRHNLGKQIETAYEVYSIVQGQKRNYHVLSHAITTVGS